jgi:DNA modification methylase
MAKCKHKPRPSEQLFPDSQRDLFEKSYQEKLEEERNQPVECLGMTFENDEKRREYFLEKLREKLKDPEFRKIEGFPIGEDEDILSLSDPPYYTACPNPFIENFIKQYGKPYDPATDNYSREPFAADVSEGKNDPIYNAHSYHTKVPHKAIMRYILHYTEPEDGVFDGFCGTGMTGVAAQMCGDRATVESLGYQVKPDGTILRQETDDNGKNVWVPFSVLGTRRVILNDLSPAATFIAYNYNMPVDVTTFEYEAKRILAEVEEECGWMYETKHKDGRIGRINYTVWSDVFICPECAGEVVFYEAAIDKESGRVNKKFSCSHCTTELTKRNLDHAWTSKYDDSLGKTIKQAKQIPVLINYSLAKQRFEKSPDDTDIALLKKIEASTVPYDFPKNRLMDGKETRRNDPIGITHMHHFYMKRSLWVLAALINKTNQIKAQLIKSFCQFLFQQWAVGFSKLNRYSPTHYSQNNRNLSGTLYVGSQLSEVSPSYAFDQKLKRLVKAFGFHCSYSGPITTQSSDCIDLPACCFDYVFVDPPFGANLYYSELNCLWEAWMRVLTNNETEAIENDVQGKGLNEYRQLMTGCFREVYRILKPGRWMTVEFSNTKASVWNSIQTALTEAGFIVANVSALDKKQRSFKVVTTPTAVKQDLIISAYKPNGGFEERFLNEASTEEGVWDFVRTHLKYLPVFKKQAGSLVPVPERDPRILFDQMVAYYVRKGYPVPISSQEFQLGLVQRFPERDGMYFLPDQAAEYDKKRMTVKEVLQLQLFVSDEASAIQWLKQQITKKPQTFQDINPLFMKEIGGWQKHEKALELSELLKENFLCYDGKGLVPEQIHAYLSSNWKDMRNLPKDDSALRAKAKNRWYVPDPNKAGDLEKLRERALLREFDEYRESKQKRLKVFRLEAVRSGFKKAWQERDYGTIIAVARKIPDKILQEDAKLLMWYDQAVTRIGGE